MLKITFAIIALGFIILLAALTWIPTWIISFGGPIYDFCKETFGEGENDMDQLWWMVSHP
jgi:hypothetical protein